MKIASLRLGDASHRLEDLISPPDDGSTYVIAAPESSHKPHRGFREDLVDHPDWAPRTPALSADGYIADSIALKTIRRATLISSNGVVYDSGGVIIRETTKALEFHDPTLAPLERCRFDSPQPSEILPGAYMLTNHGDYCVYAHFIFDTVSAIFAARRLFDSVGLRIVMPPSNSKWPHAVLDAIGVPRNARFKAENEYVAFEKLIVSSTCSAHTTYAPSSVMRDIAETLRRKYGDARKRKRLYLTRRAASTTTWRELANDAELITKLQPLGFTPIDAGSIPFKEQVKLFSQAEFIIGFHSSALTNAIFAKKGCFVLDILPDYWANIGGMFTQNLTNLFDLNYFYFMAKSERFGNGGISWVDADLVVDRVKKALTGAR